LVACAGRIFAGLYSSPRLLATRFLRAPQAADLAEEVLGCGADIIHAQFLGVASTLALAASRAAGIPLTVAAHARDIVCGGELVAGDHARAIFTCCELNVKDLVAKGIPAEKIVLSYHGIPRAESHRRPGTRAERKTPLILSAGRFVEKKGFEYLIRALGELKVAGCRFETVICGDGPLGKNLVETTNSLSLSETVRFAGWKDQEALGQLLDEADVLVCPSVVASDGDRDGVPNIILEAFAKGVPVIATDAGGIPEAVIAGKTGLVVPQKDPKALAEAIGTLLRDTSAGASLATGASQLLEERFNLEKNVTIIAEKWGRIADSKS
jgi:glycosyltransferase involved in cell wall biosynthesis